MEKKTRSLARLLCYPASESKRLEKERERGRRALRRPVYQCLVGPRAAGGRPPASRVPVALPPAGTYMARRRRKIIRRANRGQKAEFLACLTQGEAKSTVYLTRTLSTRCNLTILLHERLRIRRPDLRSSCTSSTVVRTSLTLNQFVTINNIRPTQSPGAG